MSACGRSPRLPPDEAVPVPEAQEGGAARPEPRLLADLADRGLLKGPRLFIFEDLLVQLDRGEGDGTMINELPTMDLPSSGQPANLIRTSNKQP